MAESVTNSTEETKANTPLTNQQSQENREELIEDIVQLLNRLFEPTNLSHNAYLTQRATGVSFQIPVKFIYEEYKIKTKSYDREIIDQALERAENVVVNKKGDVIESVRPKHDQLRKNITVRGITREHEAEFKKFVNSIEGVQEGVVSWNANPQLNIITIVCRDEESAHNIFNHLSGTQFKEAPIECSLDFENLYILALENLKNKKKTFPGYQQNMMYMMPPFQMQMPFFNQMNSGYMNNFFPPQNFYMPNPAMNPLNNFINPNPNGSAWQGNPQHKNTGFKRGGPRKYRGDRGRYYKNDRKSSRQATGVVVNEGDFPPLSNENQENE